MLWVGFFLARRPSILGAYLHRLRVYVQCLLQFTLHGSFLLKIVESSSVHHNHYQVVCEDQNHSTPLVVSM